jgi:hypothetical protein
MIDSLLFFLSFSALLSFPKRQRKYPRRICYHSQVLMIRRPAGRFLTMPLPPFPLAARFLAAVIRPPLLFFAID